MYRIGTGDCFTLKFFKDDTGQPSFTMMIDCGSCKGDSAKFTRFVQLISADLPDKRLDLLVITHEHLDHIIGFSRAQAEFKKLKVGQVWVGWTEDPTNTLAAHLKEKYGKDVKALKTAIQKMSAFLADPDYHARFTGEFSGTRIMAAKSSFSRGLEESLALYQDPAPLGVTGKAKGKKAVADAAAPAAGAPAPGEMARAMDYILNGLRAQTGQAPFYCYPGKPVPALPGTEGIRFYVLGPPENEAALKTEEVKDDVYDRKTSFSQNQGFNAALEGNTDEDSLPFLSCFAMNPDEKKAAYKKFFDQPDNRYRNIDTDWLNYAGALAIRLEKYINNTSLVLALEFTGSGKVLLFPGDAQSGNWESWHDPALNWKIEKGGQTLTVTATDLLNRTVFYKVGHHLSHNGTASRSGLDQMQSPELVSLATLDYNNINTIWKNTMPSPGVLTTLTAKAKGRVFRIDEGLLQTPAALAERDKMSKAGADAFAASYKVDPDFIELSFNG